MEQFKLLTQMILENADFCKIDSLLTSLELRGCAKTSGELQINTDLFWIEMAAERKVPVAKVKAAARLADQLIYEGRAGCILYLQPK